MSFDIKESVREYYGEKIQKTSDLKTGACCDCDTSPDYIKNILPLIHEEIKTKYYGCGTVVPLCLKGLKVLDVGSGTGKDCYIMSRLVGEDGFVYGIDMTENQVEVADRHLKKQMDIFGYKKPNVSFILDYMENIEGHFEERSLDIVTSNCVINLAEDKEKVIRQICKVLKNGGEFYFSDIYAGRRIPQEIRENPILYGECLGGALYIHDFERLARSIGFTDPRVVSKRRLKIENREMRDIVEDIEFYSITYRLWKLEGLEGNCEDYGHTAVYKGNIPESPLKFELDSSHLFYKDKPEPICGNTALMLSDTRFGRHFKVTGSFDNHLGPFKDCGGVTTKIEDSPDSTDTGCCC